PGGLENATSFASTPRIGTIENETLPPILRSRPVAPLTRETTSAVTLSTGMKNGAATTTAMSKTITIATPISSFFMGTPPAAGSLLRVRHFRPGTGARDSSGPRALTAENTAFRRAAPHPGGEASSRDKRNRSDGAARRRYRRHLHGRGPRAQRPAL